MVARGRVTTCGRLVQLVCLAAALSLQVAAADVAIAQPLQTEDGGLALADIGAGRKLLKTTKASKASKASKTSKLSKAAKAALAAKAAKKKPKSPPPLLPPSSPPKKKSKSPPPPVSHKGSALPSPPPPKKAQNEGSITVGATCTAPQFACYDVCCDASQSCVGLGGGEGECNTPVEGDPLPPIQQSKAVAAGAAANTPSPSPSPPPPPPPPPVYAHSVFGRR